MRRLHDALNEEPTLMQAQRQEGRTSDRLGGPASRLGDLVWLSTRNLTNRPRPTKKPVSKQRRLMKELRGHKKITRILDFEQIPLNRKTEDTPPSLGSKVVEALGDETPNLGRVNRRENCLWYPRACGRKWKHQISMFKTEKWMNRFQAAVSKHSSIQQNLNSD